MDRTKVKKMLEITMFNRLAEDNKKKIIQNRDAFEFHGYMRSNNIKIEGYRLMKNDIPIGKFEVTYYPKNRNLCCNVRSCKLVCDINDL